MEFEEIRNTLNQAWQERGPEPALPQSDAPNRGQVRLTQGGSTDLTVREVLILKINEEGFSDVLLTHPFTESATDVDLTIAQSSAKVPYNLVVQTDCRGIVWTHDLGEITGFIDDQGMQALVDVSQGEFPRGEGYGRGLKLRGFFDTRREFKETEGEIIASLSSSCTATILGIQISEKELVEFFARVDDLLRENDLQNRDLSDVRLDDREKKENEYIMAGMGKGFGNDVVQVMFQRSEKLLTAA